MAEVFGAGWRPAPSGRADPQVPVDLYTEPLIGWRVWGLGIDRWNQPVLRSAVGHDVAWPARRASVARCLRQGGHQVPAFICGCGLYASDSLGWLFRNGGRPAVPVIGRVALWGTVVEHTNGWRARYAYPSRLRLMCGTCIEEGAGSGEPSAAWIFGSSVHVTCSDHARGGADRGVALRDPRDIEAALLSAYAVDLLPAAALRPIFPSPRPRPRSEALESPPTVPTRIQTSTQRSRPRVGWLILACFLLWGPLMRALGLDRDAASTPDAVATPSNVSIPAWDPIGEPPATEILGSPKQASVRDSEFRIEFVCGEGHGRWVELVRCPRGDLLGSAESPPNPSAWCDAVTRRDRFSICWLELGSDVQLVRHPGAPNPFVRSRR